MKRDRAGSKRNAAFGLAFAWLALAASAAVADFGTKGGVEPANIEEFASFLRQDPYDLELLISYGTSKGGSAGHLALAINNSERAEETAYSANFYADRSREHAKGYYTADLMLASANGDHQRPICASACLIGALDICINPL